MKKNVGEKARKTPRSVVKPNFFTCNFSKNDTFGSQINDFEKNWISRWENRKNHTFVKNREKKKIAHEESQKRENYRPETKILP